MTLKRYNPGSAVKTNAFFIQSHGLHAGRPLKKPIPNSWQIETEVPNAFEICFVIYTSKYLKNYLRGSVIPFLSLREYRKIITPLIQNHIDNDEIILKKLKTIALLDVVIEKERQKQLYYKEMKIIIAKDLLSFFLA